MSRRKTLYPQYTGRKQARRIPVLLFSVLLLSAMSVFLWFQGIIFFNEPDKALYPVRGVDVSSWQGNIDWSVLSSQNIHFAFIKATEGSSFTDNKFEENFKNARLSTLFVGAYHFFSFESSGASQAAHFIETVPKIEGILPPAVDIEFYNGNHKNPPAKELAQAELTVLLNALTEHYGKTPIIYATKESYDLYIKDQFEGYPIWIRSVYSSPSLSDGRDWSIWQYNARASLGGYEGREKFIDLNAFNGSLEEFKARFS